MLNQPFNQNSAVALATLLHATQVVGDKDTGYTAWEMLQRECVTLEGFIMPDAFSCLTGKLTLENHPGWNWTERELLEKRWMDYGAYVNYREWSRWRKPKSLINEKVQAHFACAHVALLFGQRRIAEPHIKSAITAIYCPPWGYQTPTTTYDFIFRKDPRDTVHEWMELVVPKLKVDWETIATIYSIIDRLAVYKEA